MGFDLTRRRFLRAINSKYIYGTVPLLHSIVLLIEMAIVAKIVSRYNSYYNSRPSSGFPSAHKRLTDGLAVLTMMITNAVLGGIADTVAQTITAVRQRALRKPGGVKDSDTFAIEIHELDEKNPLASKDLIPDSKKLPPPFEFERLARFAGYGCLMAPVQLKWFAFLGMCFPISKAGGLGPTIKRVAFDQLVFAPAGLALFFTVMTVAEGGGRRAVTNKLRDMYVPTLKANYMVWPAVQLINFRIMPLQFQVPFVSTVGILWTCYLSLTNAAEEAIEDQRILNSPRIRL